jgi:flagellar assembly protein FliH
MSRDFPKKIVDYEYPDFSSEYGALPTFHLGDDEDESVTRYDEFDFTSEFGRDSADISDKGASAAGSDFSDGKPQTDDGGNPVPRAASGTRAEASSIVTDAKKEAERIIADAKKVADDLRSNAAKDAETAMSEAKEQGYQKGFELGKTEGYNKGLESGEKDIAKKNSELLQEVGHAISELDRQKTEYIKKYGEDMKDLVIAIAEKVIGVSLKSSSEVIRRMILNAIENSHDKQWARVYISEHDASLMVQEDSDILNVLRGVSDHIKIEVMENGEPGDLIIEYPDSAIDAGVGTQLENIREILANAQ